MVQFFGNYSLCLTFYLIYWIEFTRHGASPNSISYSIIPNDHISVFYVYAELLKICGDMYSGLPTIDVKTC